MGYKRDLLRLDVVERGNRAMGATRLTTTRSPTRNGSTFAGYTMPGSPDQGNLRTTAGSPVSFVLEHTNAHSLNMPDAVSLSAPLVYSQASVFALDFSWALPRKRLGV